ncbi:N-acetylmuramoyl-L-alanine amidase [Flavobacterium sp.]|uniref:N-acetylmuramoyl-L-alanine amidase family protein n=1 Tax=Flavobacterium sp. TaxID=239 RepID=UPI0035298535
MKLKKQLQKLLLLSVILLSTVVYSQNSKFKVVLDAGHGGTDPGNSYHGYVEKEIALKTTLLVGKELEKYSDIEVLYTRKTDVFWTLRQRSEYANDKDADLFVSIHCNSVKNFGPFGTETYVMGMSRSNMNLEVAKSENSVIFLEDDYKEKYNGFDPNKPESLIGLKILQEEYLSQSINLASKIEQKFAKELKRNSRGVKQAPLWVLDASYMPSVLIELGFLSNKNEGSYLNSSLGKTEMSQAIAAAILEYKKEFFQESTTNTETVQPEKTISKKTETTKETTLNKENSNAENIVFKVQISASTKKIEPKSYNFKGLSTISREKDGKLYKYFYAEESSYETSKKRLNEAKSKGYKSAFIVAYKDGVKINVADALK